MMSMVNKKERNEMDDERVFETKEGKEEVRDHEGNVCLCTTALADKPLAFCVTVKHH